MPGSCPAWYSMVWFLVIAVCSGWSHPSYQRKAQAFKHHLFTALAGSWCGSVTCCLLLRVKHTGFEVRLGWLSPGSSPYPGGGLQFDIEGFHPETLVSVFLKLSIKSRAFTSWDSAQNGDGTLRVDDGAMVLLDHCDGCLRG